MNKIFILTQDDKVHIIKNKILKYSKYLNSFNEANKKKGSFKNPFFQILSIDFSI